MAGLTQLLTGAGKIVGGLQQRKFGRREAQRGEAQYQDQLAAFRRGDFDARVSAEMAKGRTLATGLAADATRRATDRAAAQQQQLLAGAGRGDVRGLAAAAGQARQLEMGAQQAQQAGASAILGAQQQFGEYSAGVQAQNESTRRQLEAMELARGAARFDAGRLAQQEGAQTALEGATEAAVGGVEFGQQLAAEGFKKTFTGGFGRLGMRIGGPGGMQPEAEKGDENGEGDDETKKGKLFGRSFDKEATEEELTELQKLQERLKQLEAKGEINLGADRKSDAASLLAVLSAPSTRFAEAAGQSRSANEFMREGGYVGEHGGKTEGEFSHEENPIDMINEDGEKVGEVTGGELVFNPEQTGVMQELISRNEPEMLMRYLRNLLSQPQFK